AAEGFSAIHGDEVKPRFKYAVNHRHRMKYPIVQMCRMLKVSRSGYYKYVKQMQHPAKDLELAEKIRAKQESSRRTYGYRRIKLCQPIWTHFLLRRISLKRSYLCIILKIVLGFLTIPSLSSQSFILRYPYVLLLDSCFARIFSASSRSFAGCCICLTYL